MQRKMMDAYSNVKDLSLVDAKLQYINAWQALPEFGLTPFLVRFMDISKKDEVLGVAFNRLMRMDASSGEQDTRLQNIRSFFYANYS